jgi:hypothetical protein
VGDPNSTLGDDMRRYIIAAIVILIMAPVNAHPVGSELFSIRDICCDAPEWLVKLDKHQPWWLDDNLVNANITAWKEATYTEKMATLAIFLLYREYDRELPGFNGEMKRNTGYQCMNFLEIMDREVDKDYLPDHYPVWECVRQAVDVNRPQKHMY